MTSLALKILIFFIITIPWVSTSSAQRPDQSIDPVVSVSLSSPKIIFGNTVSRLVIIAHESDLRLLEREIGTEGSILTDPSCVSILLNKNELEGYYPRSIPLTEHMVRKGQVIFELPPADFINLFNSDVSQYSASHVSTPNQSGGNLSSNPTPQFVEATCTPGDTCIHRSNKDGSEELALTQQINCGPLQITASTSGNLRLDIGIGTGNVTVVELE